MTLDSLAIVSHEALMAHTARIGNSYDRSEFIESTEKYLQEKNPSLYVFIEGHAENSTDPDSVRYTVYSILHLLNSQREGDELNNLYDS